MANAKGTADRAAGIAANGQRTIHHPGVYAHVLARWCDERCGDNYAALGDRDLEEVEIEKQVEVAALTAVLSGRPLHTLSWHLPDDMPWLPSWPPRFPGFEIVVTPDDTVTLDRVRR